MGRTANKPTATTVSPPLEVQRQSGKIWSDIAPSLFHALSAGDRRSNNLHRERGHEPQHPPLPQPHVGP